jgi:hypothetical protein
MSYLYGDSTPSPLKSNFIQFLTEALDFSVHVLQASSRLDALRRRILAVKEGSEAEGLRLETIRVSVANAVERAPKGAPESPTSACTKAILANVTELVEKAAAQIAATLATDVAAIQAQEAVEREACKRALEGLLRPSKGRTTRRRAGCRLRSGSSASWTSRSPGRTRSLKWRASIGSCRSSRSTLRSREGGFARRSRIGRNGSRSITYVR